MGRGFKRTVAENSLWFVVVLAVFVVSTAISWFAFAKVDFFYGVWHDRAGVAEHIEKFAPQNRFKIDFEDTSSLERKRLFAEIVVALHHGGDGLRELTYQGPGGQQVDTLLREPEVVHLEDVARLVDLIAPVGYGAFMFGVFCLFVLYYGGAQFLSVKALLVYGAGFLLLLLIVVGVWGPTALFYELHRWVFPAGHQWFFYYQDSLMSTMMMAPDMFGYIAACWGGVSILLTGFLILLVRKGWCFLKSANP